MVSLNKMIAPSMLFATLEALPSDMKKPEKEFSMLISKKTRKKLTVSALVAAPVAMTAVGAGVVSADTVHTPDKIQNTVSTNSATSSANSSAASSASSAADSLTASASVANYRTVVIQPDSAMTNYLKQAAANGMKGEMVATITDGIHNKGDNTSDSTVTVNDGGSVTVTLADADTLAGTVTTTFSNGMVLTSTITNGKMSTQVTTEPTSGSASSATSSTASSSGNDSFSDAVSIYSSAASSAASSTASDSALRDYHAASSTASDHDYERYEAVSSASNNGVSKASTPSDASDSTTSNTNVTAFTLKYKNSDYARFSMNQSVDSLYSNVSSLIKEATDAGLDDSPYYEMLWSAQNVGGELFDAWNNDGQLTDDQKAALINNAYQLARQIADKDSNYTLSDVNENGDPSNGGGNDYDNDGGDYDNDTTDDDDTDGDNSDASAKTLPQAGEEDTSSMSIAGMAMAGAVTLAGMVGKMRKRQKVRNEDD